jgi:hypothetical protein
MAPEQAIAELRALADAARQHDVPRQEVAASIVRLADRMAGFDPLPRARSNVITIKGRRITVQTVRPQFGL